MRRLLNTYVIITALLISMYLLGVVETSYAQTQPIAIKSIRLTPPIIGVGDTFNIYIAVSVPESTQGLQALVTIETADFGVIKGNETKILKAPETVFQLTLKALSEGTYSALVRLYIINGTTPVEVDSETVTVEVLGRAKLTVEVRDILLGTPINDAIIAAVSVDNPDYKIVLNRVGEGIYEAYLHKTKYDILVGDKKQQSLYLDQDTKLTIRWPSTFSTALLIILSILSFITPMILFFMTSKPLGRQLDGGTRLVLAIMVIVVNLIVYGIGVYGFVVAGWPSSFLFLLFLFLLIYSASVNIISIVSSILGFIGKIVEERESRRGRRMQIELEKLEESIEALKEEASKLGIDVSDELGEAERLCRGAERYLESDDFDGAEWRLREASDVVRRVREKLEKARRVREVGVVEKPREPAGITRGGEEALREFRGYKLLELVGRGGFADVYKALDKNGGVVALKMYRGSDKAFVEEVGNIVQLTRKLASPYVVKVLDYGVEPKPFIVMEFYPMNLRNLIKRVKRGEVDFEKLLKLVIRVARALKYAHSVGVFHGDLKPENILVYEEEGEYYPAVADWGGGYTPGYSAPEVYESGARELSGKSDVWSFGAILYEILKGEKLFKDPLEYDAYVRSGRDLSIDLANPLRDTIERCLARDPAKRPGMDEVVAELEEQLVETVTITISSKSRGKPGLEPRDTIHLINTYIYTRRFREAEERLRYAESSGSPKDVVLIYNKIIEFYKLLEEYRGSSIPRSKAERIYNAILEAADKDLRKKLEEGKYSLRTLLQAAGDSIPPELHELLRECLEYINDMVAAYYTRLST